MRATARNLRVAQGRSSLLHTDVPPPRSVEVINSAIPGRVRIRVPGLYRNPKLCRFLDEQLPGRGGIIGAAASELTGNVLLTYEAHLPLAVVVSLVQEGARNQKLAPRTIEAPALKRPIPVSDKTSRLQAIWKTARALARNPETVLASLRPWHGMSGEEVAEILRSSPTAGIPAFEAESRVRLDGPNTLPERQPRSAAEIFVRQFASLPVALLGASALLSIATGGLADAVVIFAVVLLNAAIGTKTEAQAEKTISSLMSLSEPRVRVIRNGSSEEIDGSKLAVGDLMVLQRGQYIPADARLVEVQDLTVDESALTGESVPVEKIIAPLTVDASVSIADRKNMVYRGTIVTGGSGKAIVVATGMRTEIGHIHQLVNSAARPETLIERQLGQLGRQLVMVTCAVTGLVFVVGLLRGYRLLQMLKISTALAVAAVPEGLPAVATTTMAYGVWRLRKQNVLVRRLDALETLGAIQVLCFDKTGTVTVNRMSVVGGLLGITPFSLNVARADSRDTDFYHLVRALVLCNEAELEVHNGVSVPKGSATELALLEFAHALGFSRDELHTKYPLVQLQERTLTQNFMATFHRLDGNEQLIALKGSPVEVLKLCTHIHDAGDERLLTRKERRLITRANQKMAAEGLRVLAAAETSGIAGQLTINAGLTWLGLVAITDPPREGVRRALQQIRRAGIRTAMITGDQRTTAQAIANSIGLNRGGAAQGLDADEFYAATAESIRRVQVFSRINPGDKLRIVKAFQADNTVVAMTGDGVNDGPALKQADVGVAIGSKSTETAREVADIVLLHDSFDSILAAIREGRTIQQNISKSVHYICATNMGEILLMLAGIGMGVGQPLNPRQLLWINLLTDIFPCIALALDPAEPNVLEQPPPPRGQNFLSTSDLTTLGSQASVMAVTSMLSYLFGAAKYGIGPQASTMAFLSLASAQLVHTLGLGGGGERIFSGNGETRNPYIPWAIGVGFLTALAAAALPGIDSLLGASRIGLIDAIVCLLSAGTSFASNEILKGDHSQTSPVKR